MYRIPFADSVQTGETPTLDQVETHGTPVNYYDLRYCSVFAVNLATARAIQRDWRRDGSPLRKS